MNILIIDDEKNIRLTLADILGDEGHTIFQAESGEAGLKKLEAENDIDLVLLDVRLPGMDGIEVLKTIREKKMNLEVVMISGHGTVGTAVEAIHLGAYDFWEKPLSIARIQVALRNLSDKDNMSRQVQQDADVREDRYRMVGSSDEMDRVKSLIDRVGPTDSRVLIRGESGTGKELVAHAIHKSSKRINAPFVRFNSAAIPNDLVESELFGHEKGAFTGAQLQKLGKIELAHGGTLFLDEIGDMSGSAQAKILRVIEEGTFERLGGTKTIHVNVRILAATHKDLEAMIQEGEFREDLFYRLNVIPINLPPLRNRHGDLEQLLDYYLDKFAAELNYERKVFAPDALKLLNQYSFKGNIRELRNLVERLYILVYDKTILASDVEPHFLTNSLSQKGNYSFIDIPSFANARREFEVFYLNQALERNGGNVSKTAEAIGLQQSNLSRKIKELDLKK
jgi:two-component system, NtrC family, nitrogen regulation response regulator NtrX